MIQFIIVAFMGTIDFGGGMLSLEKWSRSDGTSVAVVEVSRVEEDAGRMNGFVVTVRPIASLGGPFDPSRFEKIDIWVTHAGPDGRQVDPPFDMPVVGETAIVVFYKLPRQETFALCPLSVEGMPGFAPLVVVDGLGDPVVMDVVKKMRRPERIAFGQSRIRDSD